MSFARPLVIALTALAGLGACSQSEIADRACPGMIAGSTAPVILSTKSPGLVISTSDAGLSMQEAVAERTARLIAAQAARQPEVVMVEPASAALRIARGQRHQRVVSVELLALTTGGQYGAFSSGFLTGWGESGRRPEFTVVTGASAGGIIAPLVFAGPAFDDRLRLNAGLSQSDVVRRRGALSLLAAPSLFSTAPLERSVRRAVDRPLVEAIAARWRSGRDLFLGATNLDKGQFELFDIGAFMAMDGVALGTKQDCLVSAIMASSAIPGFFPPHRIGGDLYTDAGVRQSVFLRGIRDGIRLSERTLGLEVRVTATMLINSDLKVRETATETDLMGLAGRTFTLVSDEGLRESIVETVDLAAASGWRLRAVTAPDFDGLGCADEEVLFSPCVTERLFEAGRGMGAADTIAWLGGAELRELARRF